MRKLLPLKKMEQNLYPQTFQILSIALGGYYYDVIKQKVNNCDELRKGISNN